jgi:hypothetical protein
MSKIVNQLLGKLSAHLKNYENETGEHLEVRIYIPNDDGQDIEYIWDGEKFIKGA